MVNTAALRTLLEGMRQSHLVVDGDCWFSCPKSGECCRDSVEDTPPEKRQCNCGADEHNAKLDKALALLEK